MNIQPHQNRILHSLLNATKMIVQKEDLVYSFTGGRSTTSKELTYQEAGALITHLKTLDAAHKMRRKIISMAHEMGWQVRVSSPNGGSRMGADMDAVNAWCKKYSFGKKPLNEYTTRELPRLVTQFEQGPYKHYLSHI
jgi:hypothetical protein